MMQMSPWTMIFISIIAGFLSTMNIWVAKISDARLHLNDLFMILLMASWMFLFDSIYQGYASRIVIGIVAVICLLWFIRGQILIDDRQYLLGMIPHHSMAITMSQRILEKSSNPGVIKLATDIIKNQNNEINYINGLLRTNSP